MFFKLCVHEYLKKVARLRFVKFPFFLFGFSGLCSAKLSNRRLPLVKAKTEKPPYSPSWPDLEETYSTVEKIKICVGKKEMSEDKRPKT